MDAITRPGRAEIIRLRPAVFKRLRDFSGEFLVDLMAPSENAQESPATGAGERRRLPFLSWYHCKGSAGVDFFSQNAVAMPVENTPTFGYCYPPPVMVGHAVQHFADCRAHAMIVVPDVVPQVSCATVRALALPKAGGSDYPTIGTACATTCACSTACARSR